MSNLLNFARMTYATNYFWAFCIFRMTYLCFAHEETVSVVDLDRFSIAKERRFLLYDVNPGEGFNLRRDVYMRAANLVRQLRENGENFVLVLPPWSDLYHWQSPSLRGTQSKLPWSLFFDLESLNRFVPVIEFEQYLEEYGKPEIELIYYLQRYEEGWKDGRWEEKLDFRPCIESHYYYQTKEETWKGWFWGYEERITAKLFYCISVQGHSNTLLPLLLAKNATATSIMVDRFETVLHDQFGDVNYWNARKSMQYSKELRRIADRYRKEELNSDDDTDLTPVPDDWRKIKKPVVNAEGGPYLCVHWRRRDFVRAHGKELPSIPGTATHIEKLLKKFDLKTVFLATDAPKSEVDELANHLKHLDAVSVKRYVPPASVLDKFKDGGVSIIDQWICSHARHFVGSHVSTFSFRIQDDREILGFDPATTFNRLCPDNTSDCEQPAKWKIVHS